MDNTFRAVKARRLVGNGDTTEGQPGWPFWIIYRTDGTFECGDYDRYSRLWDDPRDYFMFRGIDVDDDAAVNASWESRHYTPMYIGQVGHEVHVRADIRYRGSWLIEYEKTEIDDPNQRTNRHDVFLAPYENLDDREHFNAFIASTIHNLEAVKRLAEQLNGRQLQNLNPRAAVYSCKRCGNVFRTGTRGPIPKLCATCRR